MGNKVEQSSRKRLLLKIKYIDGEAWDWLDNYSCDIKKVEGIMGGMISVVSDTTVKYSLTVGYESSSDVLFDNGYTCVTFLPDIGNWCVNAIYDVDGHIVEWYFDILKDKGIDITGRHFYYDLYLDVVILPDYQVVILDEDELQEALDSGIIDEDDYNMAYKTSEYIINVVAKNISFMEDFLTGYLEATKRV